MKNDRLVVYLLLFLNFTSFSCDKDYEYSFDGFEPKMTVNAEISPQEGLLVQVSHASAPSGDLVPIEQLWITDAKVVVFEEDQLLGSLSYQGQGLYKPAFDLQPKPGLSYRLEVRHGTNGLVKSESVIVPLAPKIENAHIALLDRKSINNLPLYAIRFTLEDEKVANFYKVQAIGRSRLTAATVQPFVELHDDKLRELCEAINARQSLYLKDICFNGQKILFDFEIELRDVTLVKGAGDFEKFPTDFIETRLYSITEDYFLYQRTGNIPEDFSLAFSDPEPLHSNMVGGYGIFKAFNYAKYIFAIR
jgi:Domain of unknown function (DUF4249)